MGQTETVMKKAFYKSKTIVFNILLALIAAVAVYEPQVEELFGRKAYLALLLGSVVVNIILRSVTSQPIGRSDG